MSANDDTHIEARDLTMAYGDFLIQQDLNFTIKRGEVFIIKEGNTNGLIYRLSRL